MVIFQVAMLSYQRLFPFIWVNYNISLNSSGMISLINHDSRLRENSEVVIKFTQISRYAYNILLTTIHHY